MSAVHSTTVPLAAPAVDTRRLRRGSVLASPEAQPRIATSSNVMLFLATEGGADPDSQTVTLSNAGGATLSWTSTINDAWIACSPTSGAAPASVTVSITLGVLTPGVHTGSISFASDTASNSPYVFPVVLVVTEAGVGVSSIERLSSTRVRVHFTVPVVNNAFLTAAPCYIIEDSNHVAPARVVSSVEPEDAVSPTYVDLVMDEQRSGVTYEATVSTLTAA